MRDLRIRSAISRVTCFGKEASESYETSDAQAWACPGLRLKPARPRKKSGQTQGCGNCEKESSGSLTLADCRDIDK